MQNILGTLTGKLIRLALLFRAGGGHALPGLIVETLFPGYVPAMLQKLPEGVVIITGTNGKTTTTKIVVNLLRANGKRVLTNTTGSNLVRGLASAISRHAAWLSSLPYDLAVIEVDEATAKVLVEKLKIKPRWVVGLNVSRDQLDRFGEIDTITAYVSATMRGATDGVVINANDPQLVKIAEDLGKKLQVKFFGVAAGLTKYFPSDYELASVDKKNVQRHRPKSLSVELTKFDSQKVTYKVDGKDFTAELRLSGQHNFLNGAAALALCKQLLPKVSDNDLIRGLSEVSLAFGRGEKYRLKNQAVIELVLVKNPASFTQALSSYASSGSPLMIAINDNIADGRDVSWLWDINFSPLAGQTVSITSGTRAADMALRLSYDGIRTEEIEPHLIKALAHLSGKTKNGTILATYTAMLQLYRLLAKEGQRL